MLGPSHRAYIFQTSSCSHDSSCLYRTSRHCRPPHPYWTSSRPINLPNGTEAIQRNHPHYKDAAQASKRDDSKEGRRRLQCCFPGETKRQFNHATWQTSRKEGWGHRCSRPEGVCSGWIHDAAEDRKHIRYSTCGQVISVLSEQWQIRATQQASAQTTVHAARSSHTELPLVLSKLLDVPHTQLPLMPSVSPSPR